MVKLIVIKIQTLNRNTTTVANKIKNKKKCVVKYFLKKKNASNLKVEIRCLVGVQLGGFVI